MTVDDFNILDTSAQENFLDNACTLVGTWQQGEVNCDLFQCKHFYVEVYYNPELNRIERLRSFRSVEQLRPYLEQIRIERLLL